MAEIRSTDSQYNDIASEYVEALLAGLRTGDVHIYSVDSTMNEPIRDFDISTMVMNGSIYTHHYHPSPSMRITISFLVNTARLVRLRGEVRQNHDAQEKLPFLLAVKGKRAYSIPIRTEDVDDETDHP